MIHHMMIGGSHKLYGRVVRNDQRPGESLHDAIARGRRECPGCCVRTVPSTNVRWHAARGEWLAA